MGDPKATKTFWLPKKFKKSVRPSPSAPAHLLRHRALMIRPWFPRATRAQAWKEFRFRLKAIVSTATATKSPFAVGGQKHFNRTPDYPMFFWVFVSKRKRFFVLKNHQNFSYQSASAKDSCWLRSSVDTFAKTHRFLMAK